MLPFEGISVPNWPFSYRIIASKGMTQLIFKMPSLLLLKLPIGCQPLNIGFLVENAPLSRQLSTFLKSYGEISSAYDGPTRGR